MNGGLIDKIE